MNNKLKKKDQLRHTLIILILNNHLKNDPNIKFFYTILVQKLHKNLVLSRLVKLSFAIWGLLVMHNGISYNITSYSVVIPDSVTSIGDCAFAFCRRLATVTIGNGVTNIGKSAFTGCVSISVVVIGESVRWMSYYAFYNCTSLTDTSGPDCSYGFKFSGTKRQWTKYVSRSGNDWHSGAPPTKI